MMTTEQREDMEEAPARCRSTGAWHTRMDALAVQLDLGALEFRDLVARRLALTENAWLAARSRLAVLRQDAATNLVSARRGTLVLLADLRQVYEAAEAVVR